MKKKITGIIGAVILIAVLSTAGLADEVNRLVQAYESKEITVEKDGVTLELTNSDGSSIYPIIYNDRTYLPMRSVAEALGVEVTWDVDTKTASLVGEVTAAQPVVEAVAEATPEKQYRDTDSERWSYRVSIPASMTDVSTSTWGLGKLISARDKDIIFPQTRCVTSIQYHDSTGAKETIAQISVFYDTDWEKVKTQASPGKVIGTYANKVYTIYTENNPYKEDSEDYANFAEAKKRLEDENYYIMFGKF